MDAYAKEQLNVTNGRDMTGLDDAAERGDADAVRGLLALGAAWMRPGRRTALMYAAEKGNIAAAEALLAALDGKPAAERQACIDANTHVHPNGAKELLKPALELAREKGHHEVASLIERAKARK
jgi:ankyrin repeat protein